MSHYGQHPVCSSCDAQASQATVERVRAMAHEEAEHAGLRPGTKEYGHAVSRLVDMALDAPVWSDCAAWSADGVACAGCSIEPSPILMQAGRRESKGATHAR